MKVSPPYAGERHPPYVRARYKRRHPIINKDLTGHLGKTLPRFDTHSIDRVTPYCHPEFTDVRGDVRVDLILDRPRCRRKPSRQVLVNTQVI